MSFRKSLLTGLSDRALNADYILSRVQNVDCSGNELYFNPAIPTVTNSGGVYNAVADGVLVLDASGVLRRVTTP